MMKKLLIYSVFLLAVCCFSINTFGQAASCGETMSALTAPTQTNVCIDGSNSADIATTLNNDTNLPDAEMALVNGGLLDAAGNPYLIGTSTDGTFDLATIDMNPLVDGVQAPVVGDEVCFSAIAYDLEAMTNLAVTFSTLCPVIAPSLGIDAALCALIPNDPSQVTGLQDVIDLAQVFGGGALSLDSAVYYLQTIDSTLTALNFGTLPPPCFAVAGFEGGPQDPTNNIWFQGTIDPSYCVSIVDCACPAVDAGTVGGEPTLCDQAGGSNPTTATYTSTGDTGGTWSIDGDGSVTIDASTGAIDATGGTVGTYTVTYMVDGGNNAIGEDCPDASATATLTVEDCTPVCTPPSAPSISVDANPICESGTGSPINATFSTTETPPAGFGYQWVLNGTNISTASGGNDATITTITPGDYSLIFTDGNGCDSPASNAITLTSEDCTEPCATINAGTVSVDAATLCDQTGANPTSATASSDGDAGGTWSIDGDGSVTIDASTGAIDATGGTAGTYTITYTVDGGVDGAGADCPDATATTTITVQSCATSTNCDVNAGTFPPSGFEW